MANIKDLMRRYPGGIKCDGEAFRWIMIMIYKLPPCFNFRETALLITTPSANLSALDGFTFYLKKRLVRIDGKPTNRLHDDDVNNYNRYSRQGWSKLSYHFYTFEPNLHFPERGHNIPELCKSLYNFLGNQDGIT